MTWFEAIVLGIVQGLTEFLPISSSAHLRITSALFFDDDAGASFTAVTQLGTETAVLVYFAKDIWRLTRTWFAGLVDPVIRRPPRALYEVHARAVAGSGQVRAGEGTERGPGTVYWRAGSMNDRDQVEAMVQRSLDYRMAWYVIIGTLPIGILGLLFKDVIRTQARNLWLISTTLIVFALVLAAAEYFGPKRRTLDQFTLTDGVVMGFAQAMALIPGVSRSGGTISAGLFLGQTRETATRYSFLLAIPAVVLSGVFSIPDVFERDGPGLTPSVAQMVVATVIAFALGYASIAWLLRWVAKHSVYVFVAYRILLGLLLLILLSTSVVTAT